jgi:hypothetical protein
MGAKTETIVFFSCLLIVENYAVFALLSKCMPRIVDELFSVCSDYRMSSADL